MTRMYISFPLSFLAVIVLSITTGFAAVSQADSARITDRQLNAWEHAITENELAGFLVRATATDMPDWPFCVSPDYDRGLDSDLTRLHDRCRAAAENIIRMLLDSADKPLDPDWDFLRRLIDFRDKVFDAGAYVSYVLADAINIYAYYEFVRVLRETWDAETGREIYERLAARAATTDDFVTLLRFETGRDVGDIAKDFVDRSLREAEEKGEIRENELETYPHLITAAHFYTVAYLSHENNSGLPSTIKEALLSTLLPNHKTDEGYYIDSIKLIHNRNIPFLMYRRWRWDFYITVPRKFLVEFVEINNNDPVDFSPDVFEELSNNIEIPDEMISNLKLYRTKSGYSVYDLMMNANVETTVKFKLSAD